MKAHGLRMTRALEGLALVAAQFVRQVLPCSARGGLSFVVQRFVRAVANTMRLRRGDAEPFDLLFASESHLPHPRRHQAEREARHDTASHDGEDAERGHAGTIKCKPRAMSIPKATDASIVSTNCVSVAGEFHQTLNRSRRVSLRGEGNNSGKSE